jgi:hypothetical protein
MNRETTGLFSIKILLKVQSQKSMYTPGTGHSGILDPHPEIVSIITDLLKKIRATGSVVNGSTGCIVILGVLHQRFQKSCLKMEATSGYQAYGFEISVPPEWDGHLGEALLQLKSSQQIIIIRAT